MIDSVCVPPSLQGNGDALIHAAQNGGIPADGTRDSAWEWGTQQGDEHTHPQPRLFEDLVSSLHARGVMGCQRQLGKALLLTLVDREVRCHCGALLVRQLPSPGADQIPFQSFWVRLFTSCQIDFPRVQIFRAEWYRFFIQPAWILCKRLVDTSL